MRDASCPSLAVGFFDGVHLGHQAILRGADAVLTFRNHPLTVLAPARAPKLIYSLDEKLSALRAAGVERVEALEFTSELATLSPVEFARRHLVGFAEIRCGENWRFGKGGEGDADFLRQQGFKVTVVDYVKSGDAAISSTRIRACLEKGNLSAAAAMLGRQYAVTGKRTAGKHLGSELGFPTVNFKVRPLPIPRGVYEARLSGMVALANYGIAPTMGEAAWREPMLELHCLAKVPEIVPDTVTLIRYLRPEKRFDSLAELRHQIASDCAAVNFLPSVNNSLTIGSYNS